MKISNVAFDACRNYVLDCAHLLNEATTARILGRIRNRDIAYLAGVGDSPSALNRMEAECLMQVAAFFKKNKAYSHEGKCSAAALASFNKSEDECAATNERLLAHYLDPDKDIEFYVERMRTYISQVLGPFRPFAERLPSLLRVTDGATASTSRKESLPHLKVRRAIQSTTGAAPILRALCDHLGYGHARVEELNINRVELVPKNWKTYRSIACEPGGNVPLQLAVDEYVKKRLRKYGIDLRFQLRNYEMARSGSVEDDVVTIDLERASDCTARLLPHFLFEDKLWCQYLEATRTPTYLLPSGRMGSYSKFSSMGNGYTFVLETLIFAAACWATGASKYSVYGDDIVITTEHALTLIDLLAFLGFTTNVDKTHLWGPFRESCGGNFYDGYDITPFYLRDVDQRKTTWSHNVNGFVRVAKGERLRDYALSIQKEMKLPFVPYSLSTIAGVHVDAHDAYKLGLIRRKGKTGDLYYKAYVPKNRTLSDESRSTLFLWYLEGARRGSTVQNPQHPWPWTNRYKALRRGELPRLSDPTISSEVPTIGHKYVRKWVRYYPPTKVPQNLFWLLA